MLLSFVYAAVSTLLRLLLVRRGWLSVVEIEVLVLRHERRVLLRRAGGAVWRPGDRLWLADLSRCVPPAELRVFPVGRATRRRWHREVTRRRWVIQGRRRPGRPPLAAEVQALIARLAHENPRWGYVRIKSELLKLGYEVSATAIRMTLRRQGIPPAPQRAGLTWPVFLRAQAVGLLTGVSLPAGLGRTLGMCVLVVWLLLGRRARHVQPAVAAGVRRVAHRRAPHLRRSGAGTRLGQARACGPCVQELAVTTRRAGAEAASPAVAIWPASGRGRGPGEGQPSFESPAPLAPAARAPLSRARPAMDGPRRPVAQAQGGHRWRSDAPVPCLWHAQTLAADWALAAKTSPRRIGFVNPQAPRPPQ
jgi:transposase